MKGTQLDPDAAISLRQAIAMATPKAIELWLDVVDDPAERAYQLLRLSSTDRHRLGEVLDTQIGPKLLGAVDVHLAARVIKAQAIPRGAELLGALDAQLAVRILRRFHHDLRDALLSAMPIERAIALRSMLLWPIGSVAAHMSTEPLTLGPTTTAEQAVEQIRDRISNLRDDADAGSCVYVTGPEQQLLGVLTEDQAVGIREVETTEDAEKQGGSTPLEVPYLRASPWRLWRKRIIWLLVLFVAEAYTGTVLRAFEDEMEAVVALAFFIPLLIGTGGNTGTQITPTLVRAMGTGQVRFRDLPAVVTKELSTGTLIALAMALAAMIRAWSHGVGPQITLTVCLTVAAIVMWSALVSSILPLLLKKVWIDPAVVSAPMIATIVDGTGLMIYFMIAHLTLPQLAGL